MNVMIRSPIIKNEPREDDHPTNYNLQLVSSVKQESEINELNPYDTHQRFDPHNKSPSLSPASALIPPASAIVAGVTAGLLPPLSPLNKLDTSDLMEPSVIEKFLAEVKGAPASKLSPINSLSDAEEQKCERRKIKRTHRNHRKSSLGASSSGSDSDTAAGDEAKTLKREESKRLLRLSPVASLVSAMSSGAEGSGKEKSRVRSRPIKKKTKLGSKRDTEGESDNNNTILAANSNSISNTTVPQLTATTTTTTGRVKCETPEKGRGGSAGSRKKALVGVPVLNDMIKAPVSPLSSSSSSSSSDEGSDGGKAKKATASDVDDEVESGEIESKARRKEPKGLVNGVGGASSIASSSSSSSSSGGSSSSSSSSSGEDSDGGAVKEDIRSTPSKKSPKFLAANVKQQQQQQRTPTQQMMSPKVTLPRKSSSNLLSLDENSNSLSSPNRRQRHNSLSKVPSGQLCSPIANVKGATPSSVHSDRSTGSGSKNNNSRGRGTPSRGGSAQKPSSSSLIAAMVAGKKSSNNSGKKVKSSATVPSSQSEASGDSGADSEEERKTKSLTLKKLFSTSKTEGGAKGAKGGKGKGQGQVVVMDHAEEMQQVSGNRERGSCIR